MRLESDDDRRNPRVVRSITDDTLEWLFKPRTFGELFCRAMGPDRFEEEVDKAVGGRPYWMSCGSSLYAQMIILNEREYLKEKERRKERATP